jgi:hypothetical protein
LRRALLFVEEKVKEKTEQALAQAMNQVCGKIRQVMPQAVQMAGEEFSGELTIKIAMNCGGIPSRPRVTLSF